MFFEAYFVLDGDITFALDGRTTTHGPETFVLVPAGDQAPTPQERGTRTDEPPRDGASLTVPAGPFAEGVDG